MRFSKLNLVPNTGTDKIMKMPTGFANCSPFGKINVDWAPKSRKFTVNQLVWKIRISKLNLGLLPKSCKNTLSKPGSLEDQDPKSEIFKIEFGPKIPATAKLWKCQQVMLNVYLLAKSLGTKTMQIHCKPAGLEDQDLKTEPGFDPKIMQIHAN